MALTRAFNLLTRTFNLSTRAFSLLTHGFELVTREFELVTRGFELVTRNSCFTFPQMERHFIVSSIFYYYDLAKWSVFN